MEANGGIVPAELTLGVADIDPALEEQLVDGLLYAFQEQQSEHAQDALTLMTSFGVIINALGQRCKLYLPQIAGIIKWRLNNKTARVRQQALAPQAQGVRIVCAEGEVVEDLQAGSGRILADRSHRRDQATGEDVLRDPGPRARRRPH